MYKSSALVLLLSLLLASCGFQLRGTGDFNLDVASVAVSAANSQSELADEVESILKSLSVPLLGATEAQYIVRLEDESTTRRAVATSGDITVSEYELRVSVVAEIVDQAGDVLVPSTRLFTERIYSFDRNNYVGNAEEEALLTSEMRRDLASQLIRRFSARLRGKSNAT